MFRSIIILIVILQIPIHLNGQRNFPGKTSNDLSIKVIDTLKVEKHKGLIGYRIRLIWLNDTLIVSRRDKNSIIDKTKGEGHASLTEASAQNCYSYALEKYFEDDSMYSQNLFDKYTSIDGANFMKIINKHFHLIKEFPTYPRRNLKSKIPGNVLVGFQDKDGRIIHLTYYKEGLFYSKGGMWQAGKFDNLKKFLKKQYKDTKFIKVYKLSGS